MLECKYCGRVGKSEKSNWIHQSRCAKNDLRFVQEPWNKGTTGKVVAWNKGKVGIKGTPHSEETKQRLSDVAKERSLGGYVKGSGRGKKGWYRGYFCDSSWELAFLLYHLDHGKDIKRCDEMRHYNWEGATRNYHPDFVVDGIVYEIKGYLTDQTKAKSSANPDVVVLDKEAMSKYLEYATLTYGKGFITLYE